MTETENTWKIAAGTITLAGTPIGDPNDASPKLRSALVQADIIAAEDTRRALNLAQRLELNIGGKLISLHEHNEAIKAQEIILAAQSGKSILVISDAGMPSVSDPGYRLVQTAIQKKVPVTVIPGPSAVLTALAISGLPTDRFTFEGFLARKDGQRIKQLQEVAKDKRTLVYFDSPRRVHDSLKVMADVLGPQRPAALCRELTKTHEEVLRGTIKELIDKTSQGVLGEICLVIQGANPEPEKIEDHIDAVLSLAESGLKLKAAAAHVAESTGLRKNELYSAALKARAGEN
ncbi:16S rRNA (cytidine(1402)-2'-O)-methyltransferase [Actinomycetaceae bacterium TAE3-ERU4]|nr:16S rRNA (cytidine(1402)-2'-O)-methyltransferase [Actinomycetaceae bacterium TAE3-ERU4]